jgi:maltose/moltooligosaccharide transporter
MNEKPPLGFWPIWNLCFGFVGIQFALALQNANLSRIYQTLGADLNDVAVLWIAAPLTGLIIQPIVGHYSDRSWGRFGRRSPYLFGGGVLAALALVAMPNSPTLWIAAGLLWLLDTGINISMGPIRALVGDQLPSAQRARGYSVQTFFISAGSVIASLLPWCLAQLGVDNVAGPGEVPITVKISFYLGAIAVVGALSWTVLRTREYSPAQLAQFSDTQQEIAATPLLPRTLDRAGIAWLALGTLAAIAMYLLHAQWQLYLIACGALAYGVAEVLCAAQRAPQLLTQLVGDLHNMPAMMRRLAPVQLFSWFALFAMWTYTTAAVAQVHFGAKDTASDAWNAGANWTGVLFAAYNGVTIVAAVCIPLLAQRIGLRMTHVINLVLGGVGLAAFALVRDPLWLLAAMVGVGFAWGSILSVPYALLSACVPSHKMGAYMGIFNLFIVIPQILAASALGFVLKHFFGNAPIAALVIAGASLGLAALFALRIQEEPAR